MDKATIIVTDGKGRIEIRQGQTTYTIIVKQYGILTIHGEYANADGTRAENTSITMACIDRTTPDVYLA